MSKSTYLIMYAFFGVPLIVSAVGFDRYTFPKSIWILFLFGLIAVAGIFFLFSHQKITLKIHKKINIFLALLSGSFLVSTIFSDAPVLSLWGKFSNLQGLIFWSYILIFFILCWHFFQQKQRQKKLFQVTKIVGAIVSAIALLQLFDIDFFNQNFNIKEHVYRVFGTFGQPNMLGQWLIFPLIIFGFSLTNRWKKQDFNSLFYYNWFGFLLTFGTLIATKNRATWLAVFMLSGIIFLRSKKIKNLYKIVSTTLGLIGIFLLKYFSIINVRSISSRLILWRESLQTITWENFWFGNGLNTFQDQFLQVMPIEVFQYENFYSLPNSPHNEFLSVLVQRGLFGIILYIIPIIWLAKLWWQKKITTQTQKICATALAVSFISVQFSFFTLEHFIFISAFAAILLVESTQLKTVEIKISTLKKIITSLILIIFAIFSWWSATTIWQTNKAIPKAIDSYLYQAPEAFENFKNIEKKFAYYSYPKKLLFNFFAQEKDLSQTLTSQSNIHKNYEYFLHEFLFASKNHHQADMENAANHAIKLAPNAPIVYTTIGDEYFKKNNWIEAQKNYSILLNLAPDWYNSDQKICQKNESCRLFTKHASAFQNSMQQFEWMVVSGL